jgi:hypothetical protein
MSSSFSERVAANQPLLETALTAGSLIISAVVALVGWILRNRAEAKETRARYTLARVNAQISELFGPLVGLSHAMRSSFNAFLTANASLFTEEAYRNRKVFPTTDPVLVRQWRLWVRTVFHPLNLACEEILLTKSSLLVDEVFPDKFLGLLAHVSAYKPIVAGWDAQGDRPLEPRDFTREANTSQVPFPEGFQDLVFETFNELVKRQTALMKLCSEGQFTGREAKLTAKAADRNADDAVELMETTRK